jgi:hypothetical protein
LAVAELVLRRRARRQQHLSTTVCPKPSFPMPSLPSSAQNRSFNSGIVQRRSVLALMEMAKIDRFLYRHAFKEGTFSAMQSQMRSRKPSINLRCCIYRIAVALEDPLHSHARCVRRFDW